VTYFTIHIGDHLFVSQEFSDARDADDARYNLDGRDINGSRIIVEFAKGVIYQSSLAMQFTFYPFSISDADSLFHLNTNFIVV